MSHRFVWIDIPVLDLDRAIAFYSAVYGEPVQLTEGPGFKFGLLPHGADDVAGCLYQPGDNDGNKPSAQGPLVYLNADGRLAAAVQAVGSHGGRVLQESHPIGPHGWRAIVLDSEGNRIALHSMTA
jgi:predicted enzyme related to lactoylglutathione lyase